MRGHWHEEQIALAITEPPARSLEGRSTPWRDAREWIDRVRAAGELREVRGVDWERGIGEVTEMLDHAEGSPCVLFDEIPGYPAGRRVLVNTNGTPVRQAVTLNLPPSEGTDGFCLVRGDPSLLRTFTTWIGSPTSSRRPQCLAAKSPSESKS